jgi:hypothetical protein
MDSPCATAQSGGLPHSDIRGSPGARPSPRLFAACHVLHRLSVPRHPPDALVVLRPRPAPSTQDQRSDDRGQCQTIPAGLLAPSGAVAPTAAPADARAPAARIPMLQVQPRPSSRRMAGDGRTCFTVTTRFTISENRGQRSEDRPTGPSRLSVTTRGPNARRHAQRLSDLCAPSSVVCTWWAWAELNGRPHAYQACALTN